MSQSDREECRGQQSFVCRNSVGGDSLESGIPAGRWIRSQLRFLRFKDTLSHRSLTQKRLCNPEAQCRIHKGSPKIPILSRTNPIPRIDTYHISLRSIRILSSHLHLGLPKGVFPVGLAMRMLKALLPSSILATWPAHLNIKDLIT